MWRKVNLAFLYCSSYVAGTVKDAANRMARNTFATIENVLSEHEGESQWTKATGEIRGATDLRHCAVSLHVLVGFDYAHTFD